VKLVSFRHAGCDSFGVLAENRVFDLACAEACDLKSALALGADELCRLLGRAQVCHSLDQVQLLPVIPNPEKILCVGLNYESHRLETGMPEQQYPTLFTRFASTQVAHGQPLIRPGVSEKLDFEGELAVIIGREGRHIEQQDAWHYIAGLSCYNDASVRDWQMHTPQFTAGKNFDGTGAFGPYLVTMDEFDDVEALQLTTRLNGQQVQQAPLSDLIFSIPQLLAYISSFCTLRPGDVIVTGTPGGVGVKRKPRLYLKPGDTIEVEISGIGTLSNPVIDELELTLV